MKRIFTQLGVFFKTSGVILSSASLCCLMLVLGWVGVNPAAAQSVSNQSVLLAWGVDAPAAAEEEGMGSKLRQGLDNLFGSGTSDQVEGSAKENLGKVKGRIDSGAYQKDGVPKVTAERKLDDSYYRVKDSAERLVDDLGETADKTGESARDFFGK